jgi:hypothetical protein
MPWYSCFTCCFTNRKSSRRGDHHSNQTHDDSSPRRISGSDPSGTVPSSGVGTPTRIAKAVSPEEGTTDLPPLTVEHAKDFALSVQTPKTDEGKVQNGSERLENGTQRNGITLGGLHVTNWRDADPNEGVRAIRAQVKGGDALPPDGFDRNLTTKHTAMIGGGGGGAQAVFMPWDDRGGDVHMTLGRDGPDHFYTSLLSGCTVAITDNAGVLTIHHCGVADPSNLPFKDQVETSADGWLSLVRHVDGLDDAAPIHAIHAADYLDGRKDAPITYGAVFGIRDEAGNWSFYLQGNFVDPADGVAKPGRLLQFYPNRQELGTG